MKSPAVSSTISRTAPISRFAVDPRHTGANTYFLKQYNSALVTIDEIFTMKFLINYWQSTFRLTIPDVKEKHMKIMKIAKIIENLFRKFIVVALFKIRLVILIRKLIVGFFQNSILIPMRSQISTKKTILTDSTECSRCCFFNKTSAQIFRSDWT